MTTHKDDSESIYYSVDAEESLLGSILLEPNLMVDFSDRLTPDMFFVSSHRLIYQAMQDTFKAGNNADLIGVSTYLADRDKLDRVGGTAKITSLLNRTVGNANFGARVDLVIDKYQRRRLRYVGNQIVQLSQTPTFDLDSLYAQANEHLSGAIEESWGKTILEHNMYPAQRLFDSLGDSSQVIPTGFYDADCLLTGLGEGTLTILGGRTSMGKSQVALNLALNMALTLNLPVSFFSLEMRAEDLEQRLWSMVSVSDAFEGKGFAPIDADRIIRYRGGEELSAQEVENIVNIMSLCADLPLHICDRRDLSVSKMASLLLSLKREHGRIGPVFIDYIQLMARGNNAAEVSYNLAAIARDLFKLAAQIQAPIILLSQINRNVESRNDKRPTLADLSQSGGLETIADNIIFVYRDEYYNPTTAQRNMLELIVAKARYGKTGKVKLFFNGKHSLVKNYYRPAIG